MNEQLTEILKTIKILEGQVKLLLNADAETDNRLTDTENKIYQLIKKVKPNSEGWLFFKIADLVETFNNLYDEDYSSKEAYTVIDAIVAKGLLEKKELTSKGGYQYKVYRLTETAETTTETAKPKTPLDTLFE